MTKRIMNTKGPLILLVFVFATILIHAISFNHKSEISNPNPKITFPEQKILIHGPLDINQATAKDLDAIPYIGPSLARRIIDYRQAYGAFQNLQKLVQVKGIGQRKLKIIEPYVVVIARSPQGDVAIQ